MEHFTDYDLRTMSLDCANDVLDFSEKCRWIEIHEQLDGCPIFGYDINKKGLIFERVLPF